MPISVCNKVKMLCARSQNAARPSRLQMRVLTTFSAESAFGPPPASFSFSWAIVWHAMVSNFLRLMSSIPPFARRRAIRG